MEEILLNTLKDLKNKISIMENDQKQLEMEINEIEIEKNRLLENMQTLVKQKVENDLDNISMSTLTAQLGKVPVGDDKPQLKSLIEINEPNKKMLSMELYGLAEEYGRGKMNAQLAKIEADKLELLTTSNELNNKKMELNLQYNDEQILTQKLEQLAVQFSNEHCEQQKDKEKYRKQIQSTSSEIDEIQLRIDKHLNNID